jgi:hypothetical protein
MVVTGHRTDVVRLLEMVVVGQETDAVWLLGMVVIGPKRWLHPGGVAEKTRI